MQESYFLGVDHGGTSSKAVIFDSAGKMVATASRRLPLQTPHPGHTERDMEQLWQAHCAVIKEALLKSGLKAEQIKAVSFTGHGKGVYLWGKDNKPARPGIVSTDSRAGEIVSRWQKNGTAKSAYPLIYQEVLAGQPVALLNWLMENEPDTLKNTRYLFGVTDYVRYRMTGKACAEMTNMSGSGLVNLNTRDYDPAILKIFGLEALRDILPPLTDSGAVGGRVTEECAAICGLLPGTPVAAGMFDIDACALGMNVCDSSRIAVIAGTWAINEYISKSPVTDGSVKMNSLYCLEGYYLQEECSPTSASNYDWLLDNFMKEAAAAENKNLYAWANKLVDQVKPDEHELVFLPFLYGGIDDARHKALLFGLEVWHTRAHVTRAVCEGIVFGHKLQVERLQKSRKVPVDTVRLAGGIVRSEVWVQLFADILQLKVETIEADELGALGAAMTAAKVYGLYGSLEDAAFSMSRITKIYVPNPELKDIYEKKFEKFQKVAQAAKALYD